MTTCPDCNGAGKTVGFVDYAPPNRHLSGFRTSPCRRCKGTGEISEEEAARVEAGRKLRDDRVSRGLSQLQEAERLGIDVFDLNRREHGREAK